MKLSIVEVTPATFAQVQDIFWKTWVATYLRLIPLEDLKSYFDERYSVHSLGDLFRSRSVWGYLATLDDVPAGALITRFREDEGRFYVASLYVLPEFQGKGVGARLMATAAEKAHMCGVKDIWLGVMSGNTDSVNWYKRQGFCFIEEIPFTMGKTTVQHLIGHKEI